MIAITVLFCIMMGIGIVEVVHYLYQAKNKEYNNIENTADNTVKNDNNDFTAKEIACLSGSVVTLNVYDENEDIIATGSGCIVNDDKTIVTNFHVVNGACRVDALISDEEICISHLKYYDEDRDVAILCVEKSTGIVPLEIDDTKQFEVGDDIFTIGSPLGMENTVSDGIISAIRNNDYYTDIQITAPISHGSSGGALLNTQGKLIGITYGSYEDGQNMNLAIPISEISDYLLCDNKIEFDKLSRMSNSVGNSNEFYSEEECRIVVTDDYIYECYNSKNEIYRENKDGSNRTKMGINGTFLSVYGGNLYYINNNNSDISCYNFDLNKETQNLLKKMNCNLKKGAVIEKLFITDNGYTVLYYTPNLKYKFKYFLLQIGFDGKYKYADEKVPNSICLYDENTLVNYDYKSDLMSFINLSDLSVNEIECDYEPADIFVDNHNNIYLSCTYKEVIIYNIDEDTINIINKKNSNSYSINVHDGNLYYRSPKGTLRLSIDENEYQMITKEYCLNQISVVGNLIYGIGVKDSDDFIGGEYTEYYIKINDGNIEILDSEFISY